MQAHHRFLCPFNCSHNHRTILELLRHCEKEHKENLGIYKFHACTRHNDMSLLFRVYNFLNSTLLPSSNSGKSMKRNELTLLISGKIVHIIQLLELKVSVLSKAYNIHTCACTGTRITRYYFVCCRDGHYRGHKSCNVSEKIRPHQKISRKMNGTCISRMYVDVHEARHVTVRYIPTHTGHKPDCMELKFLPLPESTKEEVSLKLSQGIPTKRILQGIYIQSNIK